jgi:hypothetical protein
MHFLPPFQVALNPSNEFDGGGMWVEPIDTVFKLDQGQGERGKDWVG